MSCGVLFEEVNTLSDSKLCLEDRTHKIVDMCMNGVVTVVSAVYVMPYVWNAVFSETLMVAVGSGIYYLVIASCRQQNKMRLLSALPLKVPGNAGSRTYSAYVAEKVRTLHTDEK